MKIKNYSSYNKTNESFVWSVIKPFKILEKHVEAALDEYHSEINDENRNLSPELKDELEDLLYKIASVMVKQYITHK